jgi:hypothetical protein
MTVILNPFIAPPSSPVPVPVPAIPGNGAVSTRFGDLLRDLHPQRDPMAFLGDAVSSALDEPPQAKADADIFNEHGLFQGAMPMGAIAGLPNGAQSPVQGASLAVDDMIGGEQVTAPTVDALNFNATYAAGSSWTSGSEQIHLGGKVEQAVPRPTAQASGTATAIPQAPQGRAGATGPESRTTSVRSRLWAALSRRTAEESAALNPQISVQAVEHGLRVVARLGELDRQERVRLRDRIAGMLSRHGLVASDIDIAGRATTRKDR